MSRCVKTGLYIKAAGRIYCTDAHLEGDCLIFSGCTEQNAEAHRGLHIEVDLEVNAPNYYHERDGTIVCPAALCVVRSVKLRDMWRKWEPVLSFIVSSEKEGRK